MKKIVLAFDSFKGSVGSYDLALAAQKAIHAELPKCQVDIFPIADGGEGTLDAICSRLDTRRVFCHVSDPIMNVIEVSYAITTDSSTAIIELASASGLPLVPLALRNPMNTSTVGTGEMIFDALNRGCRDFILGIGGSATNDAGIGMLSALGYRFIDEKGEPLAPIGRNLIKIVSFDDSLVHPGLKDSRFTIVCDVSNPLYGSEGAAFVFAPQKGASIDDVILLDAGLRHFAAIIKSQKGIDIAFVQGSGAAGGMGGGILPFLNATLKPGIDTILEFLKFHEALVDADLVITGEGKIDSQTAMGKALGGVLNCAKEQGVPVVALGGSLDSCEQLEEMGFTAVLSIQPAPVSLECAMQKQFALYHMERTVRQIVRLLVSFVSRQYR